MSGEKSTITEKKDKLREIRQEVFAISTDLADLVKRINKQMEILADLDKVVVEELDET